MSEFVKDIFNMIYSAISFLVYYISCICEFICMTILYIAGIVFYAFLTVAFVVITYQAIINYQITINILMFICAFILLCWFYFTTADLLAGDIENKIVKYFIIFAWLVIAWLAKKYIFAFLLFLIGLVYSIVSEPVILLLVGIIIAASNK